MAESKTLPFIEHLTELRKRLIIIVLAVVIMDPASRTQAAHDLLVFGLGVLARSMGAK